MGDQPEGAGEVGVLAQAPGQGQGRGDARVHRAGGGVQGQVPLRRVAHAGGGGREVEEVVRVPKKKSCQCELQLPEKKKKKKKIPGFNPPFKKKKKKKKKK